MKNIIVTGVTGKSGMFFYQELCRNAEALADCHFYFLLRDEAKAEKLLHSETLNQTLLVGSLTDKAFVSSIFKMGGGENPSSYCRNRQIS